MNAYMQKTLEAATTAMVGQRIKGVRWVSAAEADEYGWEERPFEIELENGVLICASRDPEGNGPGALFTNVEECGVIGAL